jgi:hypothetical protein
MRFARFGLLIFLLLGMSVWTPQPASSRQATTPTPAPQDPQAVSALNQALAATGGAAAIKAIADYTATGNVTYHWNPEEQGSLTVQALRLIDIRFDSNLPSGLHSESIHDGQTSTKNPDGYVRRYPPSHPISSDEAFPYQAALFPGTLLLPQSMLAFVTSNPRFKISYSGIVQVDGIPVHDIRIQLILPNAAQADVMAEYHTIDFFIDPSTNLVTMTQDSIPIHVIHQVRYSNYARVSGVAVPFSISETVAGQHTRDIQLSQISFNSGLQDAAFDLQ